MSSALVRQALELVDGEESGVRRKKRGARRPAGAGQEYTHPYRAKAKKPPCPKQPSEQRVDENIKKLLALSAVSAADTTIAEKIVKRAVKGKPLLEKFEPKKEEGGSIFFPDDPDPEEPYSKFEREYFCR